MSTRCQIEFQNIEKDDKGKEYTEKRTVYQHSDGYPEEKCGIIATLKAFLKWNKGRNNDIEYMTANFIYWSKRQMEEDYFNKDYNGKTKDKNLKWSSDQLNGSTLHIGFGVCENNGFHNDIEFFYRVIVKDNKIVIEVYEVERTSWSNPVTENNLKLKQTVEVVV